MSFTETMEIHGLCNVNIYNAILKILEKYF